MNHKTKKLFESHKDDLFNFLKKICASGKGLLVKGDLLALLNNNGKNGNGKSNPLYEIVSKFTEGVCLGHSIYFEERRKIGTSDYYVFNMEEKDFALIPVETYLKAKEYYRDPNHPEDLLTLKFKTFYEKFPSIRESKNIGKGVEFLNRYLSSNMFTNPEKFRKALFDFLFVHEYNSQQLIVNEKIGDAEELSARIDKALKFLKKKNKDEPYRKLKKKLSEFGFEPGLGNTAAMIKESLEQLDGLLQNPDHQVLKDFLSRIPMIFNISVISPHGYFGQEGVLGKPDTGGQVVYILDQVKALEDELTKSLKDSGIKVKPKIIILTRLIPNPDGTKCDQKLEKVDDTKNVWILRVPFREFNRRVTDNWISRFEIWPYLSTFAEDSYSELYKEFGRRPDLIIGNYSDGNLVATILSKKFSVTQCNIAHALEKSKYLYSSLYWDEMEEQYHFSVQFTADLIAMNSANFIITSTYQEIAGTDETIGQYESFRNYTMPGLYRVAGGINLFHPKFNIVPPGVNFNLFFPFTQKKKRNPEITKEVKERIFGDYQDGAFGKLENPDLFPIFSMARLDKIKNITSLVKWFGESKELQQAANLVLVAGKLDPNTTTDIEEKEQIGLMYEYIEKYNLFNKVRWLPGDGDRNRVPEYYRVIADSKGIFVQPAQFEAFGLTVVEAMRSGLPVFATQYGGPLEIIEDGESGFHIDPVRGKQVARKIIRFFNECKKNKNYWKQISDESIDRVEKAFNWELHANRLLSLAKIYGFWRFTSNLEMTEMNAYLDVIYHTIYTPRANAILEEHSNR